ncbi:hypothetical protein Scep_001309 [Stephania cephalantha]|uniref:Uncharacterized protein n=1 Tax=Stephania cephalantha TaxID=152367 RepID=A0AAP0Q3U2_9MAGN
MLLTLAALYEFLCVILYAYAIDLFLIYVLTLSIFPGFLYEDTGSHSLGEWYALVLVASFN